MASLDLRLQGFVGNQTGNGTRDGTMWGGEFLVGDYQEFRRAGHLRYVGLPGGEQAIREPWRMAASHLLDAQCGLTPLESFVPPGSLHAVRIMIERRFNTPMTVSGAR